MIILPDPSIFVLLPLLYLSFLVFAAKRLLTYLHIFQQEEYDGPRFLKWIAAHKVFDKRLSIALLLIGFIPNIPANFLLPVLAFCFVAATEANPLKKSKKKLVLTSRARRILIPAFIFAALAGFWCLENHHTWIWIIGVQAIPLLLVISNLLLSPYESAVQKRFWLQAHEKLKRLDPVVIGVTGSFGKTSVKHILGHILKTHARTLVTPGSVNTPMGITRIIREDLDESHRYFIVEMGAYGPGSIARLCRLCPPKMGIITAIGHAHYERFKSLETVAKTKYELALSVMEQGGAMIVAEDTLRFPYAARLKDQSPGAFVTCGAENADLILRAIRQHKDGITVEIAFEGETRSLKAPLYGLHHGHNVVLAFAAARKLGIAADDIQAALQSLPQIAHRLEVKPQDDGRIFIDDAYNSNPLGFASALDLLAALGEDRRRILITPGMVELGAAHEEEHAKTGRKAGGICDILLAVMPERIPSFIAGFRETGPGKTIIEVRSFAEASAWLEQNRQSGDVILIENDLPDLYERLPRI